MDQPARSPEPAKPTPPWIFLFLDLPFGAAVGFMSIAVPFWMERRGYGIDVIGATIAVASMPHTVKLLWIPLLDLGSFRRSWYLAMAALNAAIFVAIGLAPDLVGNLPLLVALVAASQAAATTGHAANNALMATTTRFEDKGKVGGFAMASNVGSTGLLGAAALLVASASSLRAAAFLMAAIVIASAAPALLVAEPRFVDPTVARAGSLGRAAALHLLAMARDLWATVRSREGFTGLLICLAPVGCQAMSNLFTGIAGQYGAREEIVSLANGLGGGIASAIGALLGGVLADRMSRRIAYAASGGLTAVCALAMAAAPMTEWTYLWGTFTYLFAGGIAFATWAGMVLEMVGVSAASATKYALFNASANLAINYVTALDGRGGVWLRDLLGLATARGTLVTDAVLTFIGVAFLLLMVFLVPGTGRRGALSPTPAR